MGGGGTLHPYIEWSAGLLEKPRSYPNVHLNHIKSIVYSEDCSFAEYKRKNRYCYVPDICVMKFTTVLTTAEPQNDSHIQIVEVTDIKG